MSAGDAVVVRVLIVEDRQKLAKLLQHGLRKEGLAADVTFTGEDAVWMASSTAYDAVVLDLMLPGIDGLEVCRRLREQGTWSPILMLTALDRVVDRIAGLDVGADDYAELLARLRHWPGGWWWSVPRCCGWETCVWIRRPVRRGAARPSWACRRRSSAC